MAWERAEDGGPVGGEGAADAAFLDGCSETGRLLGAQEDVIAADGLEVWDEGEAWRVDILEDGSEATFCCESAPTIIGCFLY